MQIHYTAAKLHNAGLLCMEHADTVEIMPTEGARFISIPMDENKMMTLDPGHPIHAKIIAAIAASEG